jgi:hypothetical protein
MCFKNQKILQAFHTDARDRNYSEKGKVIIQVSMALFLSSKIHQGLFSVQSRGKQCAFMSNNIGSFNCPKYPTDGTDRFVKNNIE